MKKRITIALSILVSFLLLNVSSVSGQQQHYDHEKNIENITLGEIPPLDLTNGVKESLPPGWEIIMTYQISGIVIPQYAIISVYGEEPAEGSWLGVFYTDEFGVEKCGGARQYDPTVSLVLITFGDDPFTAGKDGFDSGEKYKWRIFDNTTLLEYPAIATYNPNAPNPNGTFGGYYCEILKLEAMLTIQVSIPAGWSGISFPFTPLIPDVPGIFSEVESQLLILQNNEYIFWPEGELNTFPYWLPNFGAQIKLSANATLEVSGIPGVRTIELAAGWNYLPVMSPCNVNAAEFFSPFDDEIDIVKSIAGYDLYWPAMGIYTLDELETGKAYLIKLNQPATFVFPKCN